MPGWKDPLLRMGIGKNQTPVAKTGGRYGNVARLQRLRRC